jgi:hypothetical protein
MIEAKTYTCPLCRYNLINSLYQIGHRFYTINNTTWDDLFFNILSDYADADANEVGAGANEVDMGTGAGPGANEASIIQAYLVFYTSF